MHAEAGSLWQVCIWCGSRPVVVVLQHTIDDRCSELASRAEQRSIQCFNMQMLIAHDLDASATSVPHQ